MSVSHEVVPDELFVARAAELVHAWLPASGDIVITGGPIAARVYPELVRRGATTGATVWFSDERCVPPDDPRSNYHLARETFLEPARIARVERMRGEDPPEVAARLYDARVAVAASRGFGLLLLALGEGAHLAALFAGSLAVREREHHCVAVERPDGLAGVTLTPRALGAARRTLVLASGAPSAADLARTLRSSEPPELCPARLLVANPEVLFLADASAARLLG
jgi:6-phosphogluconolactonase